ncbi:hypothetical protein LCGC14_1818130 [marine sediment metagenome]|uniref:Uncharacterized protein n=1 Tax=marine sediment metagenome TaxID=412755 RepID=A0A0F9IZH6_9ZZZZ
MKADKLKHDDERLIDKIIRRAMLRAVLWGMAIGMVLLATNQLIENLWPCGLSL